MLSILTQYSPLLTLHYSFTFFLLSIISLDSIFHSSSPPSHAESNICAYLCRKKKCRLYSLHVSLYYFPSRFFYHYAFRRRRKYITPPQTTFTLFLQSVKSKSASLAVIFNLVSFFLQFSLSSRGKISHLLHWGHSKKPLSNLYTPIKPTSISCAVISYLLLFLIHLPLKSRQNTSSLTIEYQC